MEMKTITVPVTFTGVVQVSVPAKLNEKDRMTLATKLATAQMLATDKNPDCGECLDAACEEFCEETGFTSEVFDSASIAAISGTWTTQ